MFSACADLNAFAVSIEMDREARQVDFGNRLDRMRKLSEAVLTLDKPLVVALRGAAAAAGLLYPLAADVVVAEPDAVFAFIHQGVGLSPDGAVSWLLPQIVGSRIARRFLLTAAKVSADEAFRLDLIDEIVAAGRLEEQSMKIARRLARAPSLAIRTAKRLVAQAAASAALQKLVRCENRPGGHRLTQRHAIDHGFIFAYILDQHRFRTTRGGLRIAGWLGSQTLDARPQYICVRERA